MCADIDWVQIILLNYVVQNILFMFKMHVYQMSQTIS